MLPRELQLDGVAGEVRVRHEAIEELNTATLAGLKVQIADRRFRAGNDITKPGRPRIVGKEIIGSPSERLPTSDENFHYPHRPMGRKRESRPTESARLRGHHEIHCNTGHLEHPVEYCTTCLRPGDVGHDVDQGGPAARCNVHDVKLLGHSCKEELHNGGITAGARPDEGTEVVVLTYLAEIESRIGVEDLRDLPQGAMAHKISELVDQHFTKEGKSFPSNGPGCVVSVSRQDESCSTSIIHHILRISFDISDGAMRIERFIHSTFALAPGS